MRKQRIIALALSAVMLLSANAVAVSPAALQSESAPAVSDCGNHTARGVRFVTGQVTHLDVADLTTVQVMRRGNVKVLHVPADSRFVNVNINRRGHVGELRIEGRNAMITGVGSVDAVNVIGGREITVNIPNAIVSVDKTSSKVFAGNKLVEPGATVKINKFATGYKVLEEPAPEVPEITLADQAKIVDLGWAQFLTVDFAEGQTLENTTLTVDGVAINDACTPVTTDGSMVKWEITSLDHAELVLSTEAGQQTVALGGKGAAPAVVEGQTPDYFLMNGPVYVWDFHLTNYDDAGNIRYTPAQTTIGLDAVTSATAFSRDAILHHDENALPSFVTGEVQLEFNYSTEAEKTYVDGITDVDLVAANEYRNTLNDQLHYTLTKDIRNGEHTNAVITVAIGQTNFTSNGRYFLRVTSNGKAQLFPIHVVEEIVPSMTVTGDQGYYGNEVHLRIADMTYGITSPIYRVQLTNPGQQTFELNKFDDWFLHGDLLVLYNSITNYFPETGSYTVKVWADGFQPFELTFWQDAIADRDENTQAPAMETLSVDAITTASVGGGGSSGGGSGSGDSKFMNANLIIDTDLLANAQLACELGSQDKAAAGIVSRWNSMSHLYAFNQGAEQVYTYEGFVNAVKVAHSEGEYLTFADYIASGSAVTTPNRPYAVKRVLEDNLLGETTGFQESVGFPIPAYTVEVQEDGSAVITFADEAYLAAAAKGQITLNGNSLPMQAGKDYTIDGKVLTLNQLPYGKSVLSIRVAPYATARILLDRAYPVEPVELSAKDVTKGEEIVVKCSAVHENGACDFLAHVTGVQLIAPNGYRDDIMPQGGESVFDKIGYTVDTMLNVLVIGEDTLLQDDFLNEDGTFAAGEYQIVITAEYYGDKTVTVNVADAQIEGTNATPTVADVVYNNPMFGDKLYRVSFLEEETVVETYLNAITSITLNGKAAEKVASFWNDTNSYKFSKDDVQGGADKFLDFTADCFGEGKTVEVVVHAEGYADLTFTVKDGELQLALKTAPEAADITSTSGAFGSTKVSFKAYEGIRTYLEGITSVTLNGAEAKQVTNLWGETKAYKLSVVDDSQGMFSYDAIEFTNDCFPAGTVKVVITAEGYADLTFTVVDGKLGGGEPETPALLPVPGFQKIGFQPDMFRGDHYRLQFGLVDIVTAATGGNGGGGVGPIVPPLPEPSKEMKELYAYVSALKTYLNEPKDSSITINGVEVTESENATLNESNSFLVIADEHDASRNAVVFNLDCFDNKKDAQVVIKVAGYEDLTLTFSGREIQEPQPEPQPEVPQGDLAAPIAQSMEHKYSSFSGNSYVVKLADPETSVQDHTYTFLRSLTKVTVNGTELTQAGSFGKLGDTNYTVNASAKEFVVSENGLGNDKGTFEVVLTATGYKTLTFWVIDGQLSTEAPLPAAPTVASIVRNSGFGGASYHVAFEGTEEETGAFVAAITEITADGKKLTKVSSFFGDTMSYKTANDPAFGGAYRFLDFTEDCGNQEIVIKAEGYQDLTFQLAETQTASARETGFSFGSFLGGLFGKR